MSARTIYAIGDVHGEADRLERMHARIAVDIEVNGWQALIVHLGDLVDRGPESRRTIALAMALEKKPPPGAEVLTLRGNHEQMMLDAHTPPTEISNSMLHWAMNGGEETLNSYIKANGEHPNWRDSVDSEHWAWLESLKTSHREGDLVFVHAGIDPATYPECSDDIMMWTRSRKFMQTKKWPKRAELSDILVVHGHTPTDDDKPDIERQRINIDTGAVYGGPLTCVVLADGAEPRFFSIERD